MHEGLCALALTSHQLRSARQAATPWDDDGWGCHNARTITQMIMVQSHSVGHEAVILSELKMSHIHATIPSECQPRGIVLQTTKRLAAHARKNSNANASKKTPNCRRMTKNKAKRSCVAERIPDAVA
jgi:uncharacterized membrane protein